MALSECKATFLKASLSMTLFSLLPLETLGSVPAIPSINRAGRECRPAIAWRSSPGCGLCARNLSKKAIVSCMDCGGLAGCLATLFAAWLAGSAFIQSTSHHFLPQCLH